MYSVWYLVTRCKKEIKIISSTVPDSEMIKTGGSDIKSYRMDSTSKDSLLVENKHSETGI